jgi:hypothetical protein
MAVRQKKHVTYKDKSIKISANFSAETLKSRRPWSEVFQVLKGKIWVLGHSTQKIYHSKLMEE